MLWILAGTAFLVLGLLLFLVLGLLLFDFAFVWGFVLRLFWKTPDGPEPPRLRGR